MKSGNDINLCMIEMPVSFKYFISFLLKEVHGEVLAQVVAAVAVLQRDEERVVRRRGLQRDGLLLEPIVRLACADVGQADPVVEPDRVVQGVLSAAILRLVERVLHFGERGCQCER